MSQVSGDSSLSEDNYADRRESPRNPVVGAVFCRVIEAGSMPVMRGDLVDVSLVGVGLILPFAVHVSQEVEIAFAALGTMGLTVPATVRYTFVTEHGTWRVGCQFRKRLTQAQLDAIMKELFIRGHSA